MDHYCPLVYCSFAVEIRLFGLSPKIMHLNNLLLHVANVALAVWLLSVLGANVPLALLGAGMFGLHPLGVESVAWISERKDVLYLFFTLLCLISYLHEMMRIPGLAEQRSFSAKISVDFAVFRGIAPSCAGHHGQCRAKYSPDRICATVGSHCRGMLWNHVLS